MSDQNDNLIEELRERGCRITPQRAIIVEAIESLSGHITAEQIFNVVQHKNSYISLATVYRTLDLLKELGLVTESHMGTATTHYALKTHGTHHHAICRICQKSIELPDNFFAPIKEKLDDEYNFLADTTHMVVFGWCTECQTRVEPLESKN